MPLQLATGRNAGNQHFSTTLLKDFQPQCLRNRGHSHLQTEKKDVTYFRLAFVCYMKELYESMCTGAAPKCSGNEGLESAVFALAIDRAAQNNNVVELEDIWRSLGR